jgi:biotin carboxylase
METVATSPCPRTRDAREADVGTPDVVGRLGVDRCDDVGVRVLLSDGSGLTARQAATQLAAAGHVVEVLTPDRLALTRFTAHVRRAHRVPPYGVDPFAWLDAALGIYRAGRFDALFPTQEQVAVLSRSRARLEGAGVRTAVPAFAAVSAVQDKLAAHATLSEVGLPQPDAQVVASATELARCTRLPAYVKTPIGTATMGVRYVSTSDQLTSLASLWRSEGVFADGGVLVQSPVAGTLVMIQSVFDTGDLVASHANLRLREGASGGASHKQSIDLPDVRRHLEMLGRHLGWHGALSMDAILTAGGPVYIDINPRLVEPGNAWRSGVDLVDSLLAIALGDHPPIQSPGRAAVATHQLLLAVLGVAQHQRTRRAVVSELVAGARHRHSYHNSVEELTPLAHDRRTILPVAAATMLTLARPATWRWFSSGAVSNYALTATGWRAITDHNPPSH